MALWHAIDHYSGKVLAYVFGRRQDTVFLELQSLLAPFGITRFYTDGWVPTSGISPLSSMWSVSSIPRTLLLDSGVFGSNVAREGHCLFKAMDKEGLRGGKGDNNEARRPRHIHAPGIQQEPQYNVALLRPASHGRDEPPTSAAHVLGVAQGHKRLSDSIGEMKVFQICGFLIRLLPQSRTISMPWQ